MTEASSSLPLTSRPLHVAALVKQVPAVEHAGLDEKGRLVRAGLPLQMNDYCRRAVAKGHQLAAESGGTLTVITLGPPSAEEALREAIAYGAHRGVHICDPAFAGSDTYATAQALARAIDIAGPFDLILTGRNSIDADTGQVPPSIAEFLGWPFAADVKSLSVDGERVTVALEHDDESVRATVALPAVLSCAERLCDPCKVPEPERRAAVAGDAIRRLDANALGRGPWGNAGSLTRVGPVRAIEVERARLMLDGTIDEQIGKLEAILLERGALGSRTSGDERTADSVPGGTANTAPSTDPSSGPSIAVLVEPKRHLAARELLGAAATLAARIGGSVHAIGPDPGDPIDLSDWGADCVVVLRGFGAAEPLEAAVASEMSTWCRETEPWAVLGPSTAWGREILSRVATGVRAGLTGDAISLSTDGTRLIAHKPALGGTLVADIECTTPIQMATVRAGTLPLLTPRVGAPLTITTRTLGSTAGNGGIDIEWRQRTDDFDALSAADVVIGVGQGIPHDRYSELTSWAAMLGAELGATRKVTDRGWMPRARQIGITALSVAPDLYLAIGLSGKFNHMAGVRNAGTIVAINTDPEAPVFEWADVGMVASWDVALAALAARTAAPAVTLATRAPSNQSTAS